MQEEVSDVLSLLSKQETKEMSAESIPDLGFQELLDLYDETEDHIEKISKHKKALRTIQDKLS